MQGNVAYTPNNVTIKAGQEILIVNNGTDAQSVTNGMGPDDPLAGKLFDTGPIPPRGFAEYVASNLSPGEYPFYSTNSTSTTGVLTIEPNG
jgi:plastocyanin